MVVSDVLKLDFVVAGNPVGQSRPKINTFTKRAYEEPKSKEEKLSISYIVRNTMREFGWDGPVPTTTPVGITIKSYRPIPVSKPKWFREAAASGLVVPVTKPDCDNLIKLYMDAMNGIVYNDDRQVVKLSYESFYSNEPRTEVHIEAYLCSMGDVRDKLKAGGNKE